MTGDVRRMRGLDLLQCGLPMLSLLLGLPLLHLLLLVLLLLLPLALHLVLLLLLHLKLLLLLLWHLHSALHDTHPSSPHTIPAMHIINHPLSHALHCLVMTSLLTPWLCRCLCWLRISTLIASLPLTSIPPSLPSLSPLFATCSHLDDHRTSDTLPPCLPAPTRSCTCTGRYLRKPSWRLRHQPLLQGQLGGKLGLVATWELRRKNT